MNDNIIAIDDLSN